jgi:hypothetical protein
MAILTFSGDQVAAFSQFDANGDDISFHVSKTPFLATDRVSIEVPDSCILPNGEFDPDLVNFTAITVERDGVTYPLNLASGAKIKESGSGTASEQGDRFFATNDSVSGPADGPFAALDGDKLVFTTDATRFSAPGVYTLDRSQASDFNDDGDSADNGEAADRNFNVNTICFTPGVLIRTPRGEVPAEALRPGDLVCTADNGPRRLLWTGSRALRDAPDHLRPVLIGEGALGNRRAMFVSPQHAFLVRDPDGQESLARAVHLAATRPGIRVAHGRRRVTYLHLLFDRHEVVFAEGIPTESLWPGPMALGSLEAAARAEIFALFPELRAVTRQGTVPPAFGPRARPLLRRREVAIAAAQSRRAVRARSGT